MNKLERSSKNNIIRLMCMIFIIVLFIFQSCSKQSNNISKLNDKTIEYIDSVMPNISIIMNEHIDETSLIDFENIGIEMEFRTQPFELLMRHYEALIDSGRDELYEVEDQYEIHCYKQNNKVIMRKDSDESSQLIVYNELTGFLRSESNYKNGEKLYQDILPDGNKIYQSILSLDENNAGIRYISLLQNGKYNMVYVDRLFLMEDIDSHRLIEIPKDWTNMVPENVKYYEYEKGKLTMKNEDNQQVILTKDAIRGA